MGKGGGGDQDSTTQVIPPGFIQPQLEQAAGAISADFERGPQQFFGGQTFADFNPLQQQAQAGQLAFGASPQLQAQLGGINQASLSALGGPENLLSNPAVTGALGSIESRGNRNLLENILPNVRRSAVGAGQTFGSSRADIAQAQQIGDTQQRISDAQAGFLGTQLNSARTAQTGALGLAPQTLGTGLFPSQIQAGVGAQQQGLTQQQINENIARFNFGQQAPSALTSDLVNRAAGLAGFGGTTTANLEGQGSNNFLGGLGGGIAGATLGSAIPGFGGGAAGATGLAALGPAGIGLGILGALGGAGLFG